jgi:hypothetical protein
VQLPRYAAPSIASSLPSYRNGEQVRSGWGSSSRWSSSGLCSRLCSQRGLCTAPDLPFGLLMCRSSSIEPSQRATMTSCGIYPRPFANSRCGCGGAFHSTARQQPQLNHPYASHWPRPRAQVNATRTARQDAARTFLMPGLLGSQLRLKSNPENQHGLFSTFEYIPSRSATLRRRTSPSPPQRPAPCLPRFLAALLHSDVGMRRCPLYREGTL